MPMTKRSPKKNASKVTKAAMQFLKNDAVNYATQSGQQLINSGPLALYK